MTHRGIFTAVILGAVLLASPALAVEDYKITRCPPNKPYCIQTIKPAYTVDELEKLNEVRIDPVEEARKSRVRQETGYRDPGAISLCPKGRRMTERDGCQ